MVVEAQSEIQHDIEYLYNNIEQMTAEAQMNYENGDVEASEYEMQMVMEYTEEVEELMEVSI